MTIVEQITEKFNEFFSTIPFIVRSPGRINLIGEHTDYNDGFVFPAAIDKAIYFAVSTNTEQKFRFYAYNLKEYFELDIDKLTKSKTAWANYLLGVYAQFKKNGNMLAGVDCVFGGDIPMGAGLSSSAAIENGFAFALNNIFDMGSSKLDMVKMAQQAEHEYAGVQCGIMDQFASMFGKKDNAVKLDSRTLEYDYANINLTDYSIVLCDTKVKHELASSEYNTRRKECETGVAILRQYDKNIRALRDVDMEMLQQHQSEMPKVVYKRCAYVVKENCRVEKAFVALQNNDLQQFGALMYQSHEGLRDEYEVSCKELDLLYEIARESGDVMGARMMGGGFGGCTINLVKQNKLESFTEKVNRAFSNATGVLPGIITVKIDDGTGWVNM